MKRLRIEERTISKQPKRRQERRFRLLPKQSRRLPKLYLVADEHQDVPVLVQEEIQAYSYQDLRTAVKVVNVETAILEGELVVGMT